MRKILALVLSLGLLFQQAGFAQMATQLNLSGYLNSAANTVSPSKIRPPHLRYFSYDTASNSFDLLLDKGSAGKAKDDELKAQSAEVFKYFLIGINLPNESFWVNLRPDSAEQIIDPALEQTDLGKVLLEADLQLKKDTALFTSPQNPKGKEYWDKLYKKAGEIFGQENISIPTLTRPWIVPGEVIIRYTPSSAYIYKANLKVMLEQDYLKDSAVYNFQDERLKELNEYSSGLIRELIIPELTKEINTSARYASLRQVFYSLILAQWFKQQFKGADSAYSRMIDRADLPGLTSLESWSKEKYFEAYQKSFKNGEYNLQEPVRTLSGQSVRSYFSGGANLANSGTGPEVTAVPAGTAELGGTLAANPAFAGLTADADGTVSTTDPSKAAKKEGAGYSGEPNDAFTPDVREAVGPARANAFSKKITIPYAKDNRVFRTAEGRRNLKQHTREVLDEVEDKVLTVVFGKDFEGGKQVVKRTQTDANLGWTDMIREQHPEGLKNLLKQRELAQEGIAALMRGDYHAYIRCLREYAQTRTNTSRSWLSLIMAARRGEKGLPAWVYARAKNIEENPEQYSTFIALFEQFERGAEDPATYDLYAPAEIGRAMEAAKRFYERTGQVVGIFPLGAGGFGTVCAVGGESRKAVVEFLSEFGVPELLTPAAKAAGNEGLLVSDAEDMVTGKGKYASGRHTLSFWVAAKADSDGVVIKGVEGWNDAPVLKQLGLTLQFSNDLPWVLVNKNTLEIVPLREDEDVDNAKYGDDWLVVKSWELGFDWRTYFRPDRSVISEENLRLVRERIGRNGFQDVFPRIWQWLQEEKRQGREKKLLISLPARWLDTLGSSWDLKDFRLEGTPEGNLRLSMLPSCNAIPSEYRLEVEITASDDPNVVEYVDRSGKYFKHVHRMNPSSVRYVDKAEPEPADPNAVRDVVLIKHPNPQQAARGIGLLQNKERDLTGYFAHLFGFKGGIRFTCEKMSFVPSQGGMESSNIFADSVAAIFNMLSGANFSVTEISHISLLAQINECNNITGNQGADAAWAGAGLHVYLGGIYDMQAQRKFSAVQVVGNLEQVPLDYLLDHPGFGRSNYTVPVSQQVRMSLVETQTLIGAIELLAAGDRRNRELLSHNNIILVNFANGKFGHPGLGRAQLYLERSLLRAGNEQQVADVLWHEVMQREIVRFGLQQLGLLEQLEATATTPKQRETMFIEVFGHRVVFQDVIDALTKYAHSLVANNDMAGKKYGSANDTLWYGDRSSLQYLRYNLINAIAGGRDIGDFSRENGITEENLTLAAIRMNFALRVLQASGVDLSGASLEVPLEDIHLAFKPAQKDIMVFVSGGLPVPQNNPGTPGPAVLGGIDLRNTLLNSQAQLMQLKQSLDLPKLSELRKINLEEEKTGIETLIQAGIVPSSRRVMEFVAACQARGSHQQDALLCLVNLFRLEEDSGAQTSPELKSFLALVESDNLPG